MIQISSILPTKVIDDGKRNGAVYAAMQSSIAEIGIVEPPVVFQLPRAQEQYLLLDGHLRIDILKNIGHTEVFCLLSSDDEAYTYNSHVNRLVPIQAHFMLLQALDQGVSEERAAKTLNLDVVSIRNKRNLLRDICDDAIGILKATPIPAKSIQMLRQVKPERQVEIAEMLVMTGNFSSPYCQALVAATKPQLRVETKKTKKIDNLSQEAVMRMQDELNSLQRELQVREDSYGKNFLNLMLVRGYLEKLMRNTNVTHYLQTHHQEIHRLFEQLINATSLDG